MTDARAAAFFDLDRTLIAGSSTFTFATTAWRHKLLPTKLLVGDAMRAVAFRVFGSSDERSASLRDRILDAVRGQDHLVLADLNEELIPRILARVRPESHGLVEMHNEAGRECWIVSASPIEMVEPLAKALGITGGIATRSQIVDGMYTGELDGPFVYGEGKAEAVAKLAAARGYDLRLSYAYSDSASDLPLLEMVGHPVAVNPDTALEAVARQRGWPIVVFAQRRKQAVRSTTALTGAGALATMTYLFGRRHGRIHAQVRRRLLPWR